MSISRAFFVVVVLLLALTGCGGETAIRAPAPRELTVFAAASLTDAFSELATAFEEQNEGVSVVLNFAGSSQLAAQLREGVVADVFASANPTQMQAVVDAGLVSSDVPRWFVSNRLTVVVPADNPAGIAALEDLAQPGVGLVLAVEGVPVRQYTDEIVAALPPDQQQALYANLVSEESNVRLVAAKIALGEADAGIVYTSDITPDLAAQVRQLPIPDEQNVVAVYPIAPLNDAPHPELAQAFVDLALSPEGQAILAQWGFGPPPAE